MSDLGHSRRFDDLCRMSDLHPASDVSGPGRDFAVGPEADMSAASSPRCQPRRWRQGGVARSFGQARFPKTLDQQLRVGLPAPGDEYRYCKGGIELKQTRRRLTGLRVASEMGESGCETAVSCRKGGGLTQGLLPCGDGLVKTAKLNKGIPHPSKRSMEPRVDRAHAHGTFEAPDCLLRQTRISIDPASAVPSQR